ncbi:MULTISPECIES: O-antigen ligase family protein [Pectobacterium]|uniref:O-antigen ligase family protein n=2 Tax=Pectobacterium TaxID=122277 RepID=A0AAW3RTN1_9GAMM|nr:MULTISPECIES: O-antigen ligase family protein [Pectobacterium]MBA0159649.1 O-antigen ligase family protein [Pectobacterium versatile]MBA0172259.1 O-antigen ligase family protein [Pectobacterium versatile]MBN3239306.1 O-antigen ligase family protein [Pectobacterium versatile]MBQ4795931.1 O-antigen ligase family protein [Pectobacterium versatile]MCL6339988.1 O-antigen ligase family protein [Pectobacterium carotovorum subsp. carotovorum]
MKLDFFPAYLTDADKRNFPTITAFLLGLSLPLSNQLLKVALILALLCVLRYRDMKYLRNLIVHPMVILPALMTGLLALSLLTHHHEAGPEMVEKYKKLLYVLPLALFFVLHSAQSKALFSGFLLGNGLVLVLSMAGGLFHLFPEHIDPANPTVFKLQITHNFFMAMAVFLWLERARISQGSGRIGYLLLALAACCNILFMVQGRVGYIALIAGIGAWALLSLKPRQALLAIGSGVVVICLLFTIPNRAAERITLGVHEIQNCLQQKTGDAYSACDSSMGQRTAFILQATQLIEQAPLLGNGAGSFWYHNPETGYSVNNPHNQYLLETIQNGAVGLIIFLLWMAIFAIAAWKQPPREKSIFITLLVIYLSGNLFNSFLLDSTEGHLFVILTALLLAKHIPLVQRKKNESSLPSRPS